MPKTTQRATVVLLITLMLLAAITRVNLQDALGSLLTHPVQNGFLFGLPLILMGCVIAGARWALMAGVMYGTIGLALDISTLIQELSGQAARHGVLLTSGTSGVLNLLLIVIGGRGFLDVTISPRQTAGRPQERHPPSPPFPPAT